LLARRRQRPDTAWLFLAWSDSCSKRRLSALTERILPSQLQTARPVWHDQTRAAFALHHTR
jgi:hypothetical protein